MLVPRVTSPMTVCGHCLWAAPELHITADGNHVVYFVTNSRKSGKLVVGAAVSTTGVQGPYKDVLGGPLVETASSDCFGAIDPTFFKDPADGTQYVVWKVGIHLQFKMPLRRRGDRRLHS